MAAMGIEWCLIGHSERRGEFGLPTPAESSELLATKLAYLLEKGVNCILAIGEPLPVREKGIDAVLALCDGQPTLILTGEAAMRSPECVERSCAGCTLAEALARCGPGESTCGPPPAGHTSDAGGGVVLRTGARAVEWCGQGDRLADDDRG